MQAPQGAATARIVGPRTVPGLDSDGTVPEPLIETAPTAGPRGVSSVTAPQIENGPAPLISAEHASQPQAVSSTNRAKPTSTSGRPPARTSPSQTAAADEIHIHIGRIEVTAVHEPPTPASHRKPKGREPMSLDDYLAKRRQAK
jgi:hypothetical protein